jgi:hypothetical protein
LELGSNVRRGEHGAKIYFVKQLQVAERDGEEGETRIVPMMREYTVSNVDQCEGLPDRGLTLGETKPRNRDERDATIDDFLACSGAAIREGAGNPINAVLAAAGYSFSLFLRWFRGALTRTVPGPLACSSGATLHLTSEPRTLAGLRRRIGLGPLSVRKMQSISGGERDWHLLSRLSIAASSQTM